MGSIQSAEEMESFGESLGKCFAPGTTLALIGTLGAGKTTLTRGIARGLQIEDEGWVSSPTFVLIQEYRARFPIYHFDTYRLQDESSFFALGVEEYFSGEGVCIIEWADKVFNSLPEDRLNITIHQVEEMSENSIDALIQSAIKLEKRPGISCQNEEDRDQLSGRIMNGKNDLYLWDSQNQSMVQIGNWNKLGKQSGSINKPIDDNLKKTSSEEIVKNHENSLSDRLIGKQLNSERLLQIEAQGEKAKVLLDDWFEEMFKKSLADPSREC